jgi:hypothetical protein
VMTTPSNWRTIPRDRTAMRYHRRKTAHAPRAGRLRDPATRPTFEDWLRHG